MYLKSLTVKGFKSFARPATFLFEPGVTCVVGPNGSGKSNVVDALAWVMGEQGAKSLRGGSMQDVIFAGTPQRPPLGRAEVVLTIDNGDGALPIDYAEVTISRTMFRGGGSEYAVNGERCRLVDVQELLSDSGLGRHMHVIVGQGRLDAILGASAEERRALVEEAAGILKHRRRKESTLRKLEAMQANLDRVNDLVAEIGRQLKPLGRQARAAEEARSVQATVRDATARLLADDVAVLKAQIEADETEERRAQGEAAVLREELDTARSAAGRADSAFDAGLVEASRGVLYDLKQAGDRLAGLDALTRQRLVLLEDGETPATVRVVDDEEVRAAAAHTASLASEGAEAEAALEAARAGEER
ncbi:MAG TPA: AAA family ATPase, partial [Microbacteriaceae bacterium]|nr:AAA family ATPase [Microbacteriaceae bacterium]